MFVTWPFAEDIYWSLVLSMTHHEQPGLWFARLCLWVVSRTDRKRSSIEKWMSSTPPSNVKPPSVMNHLRHSMVLHRYPHHSWENGPVSQRRADLGNTSTRVLVSQSPHRTAVSSQWRDWMWKQTDPCKVRRQLLGLPGEVPVCQWKTLLQTSR